MEGGPRVRRTRIPVAEFAAAISLGSKQMLETDEIECLMANMIYKVSGQLLGNGMKYPRSNTVSPRSS